LKNNLPTSRSVIRCKGHPGTMSPRRRQRDRLGQGNPFLWRCDIRSQEGKRTIDYHTYLDASRRVEREPSKEKGNHLLPTPGKCAVRSHSTKKRGKILLERGRIASANCKEKKRNLSRHRLVQYMFPKQPEPRGKEDNKRKEKERLFPPELQMRVRREREKGGAKVALT